MKHILRCALCEKFTLKETHCNQKTAPARPAKYNPEDRYANLKRKALEKERAEKGLL